MVRKKINRAYKFYYSTLIVLTILEVILVVYVFSKELPLYKLFPKVQENIVKAAGDSHTKISP